MNPVRTSLEVGFAGAEPPAGLANLRGRERRAIDAVAEFPFEDRQFEVVLLHATAVSPKTVKEAHRVLKPEGRLCFVVPERTRFQQGYTMPEIYSIVRDGFNIVGVERPSWWFLRRRGRTLSICARKKNWRTLDNRYRPYV